MLIYNKKILYKKNDIISKLEKKYGKIFTHNYNDIIEYYNIDNYNDIIEEYTINNYNNIENNNKYKIIYGGEMTTFQRFKLILLMLCILIIIFVLSMFSNIIYIWKLNGIIYPLIILIILINIYSIGYEKALYISNSFNNSKTEKIIKKVKETIYLVTTSIRKFPTIIPNVPRIPQINKKKTPFKDIREGIQTLIIKVKLNESRYKLEFKIPKMGEIDFPNVLALICCTWEGLKKIWKWIMKYAIEPVIDFFRPAYNVIRDAIMFAYKTFIKPFIDIGQGIWDWINDNWTQIVDVIFEILKVVDWIPGLSDEINNLRDKHNQNKDRIRLQEIEKKCEEQIRKAGYKINKKATEETNKKLNKDAESVLKTEAAGLKLEARLKQARRLNATNDDGSMKLTEEEKKEQIIVEDLKKKCIEAQLGGGGGGNILYNNYLKYNIYKCNYNLNKCKKILNNYNAKNTNINGFMKIYLIHKNKIKKRYENNIRLKYKIKYKNLIDKVKYYEKKEKKYIPKTIKKCINNYYISSIKNINKHKNDALKCINEFNELQDILKNGEKDKNYKKYLSRAQNEITGGGLFDDIGDWLERQARSIAEGAKDAIESAGRELKKAWNRFTNGIKEIPNSLEDMWNEIKKIDSFGKFFIKIGEGIAWIANWIENELPSFFGKILKIIENIGLMIKWFIKNLVMRGLKIIVTILEFFIQLIIETGKKMKIPGFASPSNPLLKLPGILNAFIKILDLPLKDVFEKMVGSLKKILKAIPTEWLTDIINGIKEILDGFLDILKSIYKQSIGAVKSALSGAGKVMDFFGLSIEDMIPGYNDFMREPDSAGAKRRVFINNAKNMILNYIKEVYVKKNIEIDETLNTAIEKYNNDKKSIENAKLDYTNKKNKLIELKKNHIRILDNKDSNIQILVDNKDKEKNKKKIAELQKEIEEEEKKLNKLIKKQSYEYEVEKNKMEELEKLYNKLKKDSYIIYKQAIKKQKDEKEILEEFKYESSLIINENKITDKFEENKITKEYNIVEKIRSLMRRIS